MKQVDFYARGDGGKLTYKGSIGYNGKGIVCTPGLRDFYVRKIPVPAYITRDHPGIKGYVDPEKDPVLYLKLLRYVFSNEYSYVTEMRDEAQGAKRDDPA